MQKTTKRKKENIENYNDERKPCKKIQSNRICYAQLHTMSLSLVSTHRRKTVKPNEMKEYIKETFLAFFFFAF